MLAFVLCVGVGRSAVDRSAVASVTALGSGPGAAVGGASAPVSPPTLPGGAIVPGGAGYAAVLTAMNEECIAMFGGSVSTPRWITTSDPARVAQLVAQLDGSSTDPIEIRDVSIPPVAEQRVSTKGGPPKGGKSGIPAAMSRSSNGARLRVGPIRGSIGVAVIVTIQRWTASGWQPVASADLLPLFSGGPLPACPPRWYDITRSNALPDPVRLAVPAASLPLFGTPTVTFDARLPKLAKGWYRMYLGIRGVAPVFAPFRIV